MRLPAILMYHHVHAESEVRGARHPHSYLPPAELDRHLDWLSRRQFVTLTLEQVLASSRLPRRSVVLTFDDGCVCFRDVVAPALAKRGQRATLFVVSGELGGLNRWDGAHGERPETLLDAGDLKELAETGMEVGCHGRSHADLTAVEDDAALEAEVSGAKAELESALGRPVRTFCYPYGAVDSRARRAVASAGFAGAVSIFGQPGASPTDRLALARMIVRPGESLFELALKARGLYPLWSHLPRLGLLRALRNRGKA